MRTKPPQCIIAATTNKQRNQQPTTNNQQLTNNKQERKTRTHCICLAAALFAFLRSCPTLSFNGAKFDEFRFAPNISTVAKFVPILWEAERLDSRVAQYGTKPRRMLYTSFLHSIDLNQMPSALRLGACNLQVSSSHHLFLQRAGHLLGGLCCDGPQQQHMQDASYYQRQDSVPQ